MEWSKAIRRKWLATAMYAGLLVVSGAYCYGQESATTRESKKEGEEVKEEFKWHLLNTAIFAVAVGFALWKLAPSFFNARSADIQKAIKDATGLKMEADFRSSEIDRKMATLPDAVKKLREQARLEMEREHERRKAETAHEAECIHTAVALEIAGLQDEGARQVRKHTAHLALQLAEQRLRNRAWERDGDGFVGDFVRLVGRGRSR